MVRLLMLLAIIFSFASFSDVPDCFKIRTGKFRISDEMTGTTIITRTKTKQIEVNDKFGSTQYDVIWTNPCTYELRNAKVLYGDKRFEGQKTNVITVQIIKVNANSYLVRTSSNFHEGVLEGEVEILK